MLHLCLPTTVLDPIDLMRGLELIKIDFILLLLIDICYRSLLIYNIYNLFWIACNMLISLRSVLPEGRKSQILLSFTDKKLKSLIYVFV